jgi:hypothetical protein
LKPKEIAPLIYASSHRKSWKVNQALKVNAWVGKIAMDDNSTMDHLHQFVDLWVNVHEVHLVEDMDDDITWNLMANDQYSAKSAYKLQFIGSISSFNSSRKNEKKSPNVGVRRCENVRSFHGRRVIPFCFFVFGPNYLVTSLFVN